MKQHSFEQKWQPFWNLFSKNLASLEDKKSDFIWDNFPADYRRICQHLSLARARC